AQKSHDWYSRLLRARRERPRCRCTGNERDELAPPHGAYQGRRLRANYSRSGPCIAAKAAELFLLRNAPLESRIQKRKTNHLQIITSDLQRTAGPYRCAKSGLTHRSKTGPYSITSSASESRLSEILMPSAFAVFRLITSSNLVGCTTGSSAGFSP